MTGAMEKPPLVLHGVPGSPYTRKMLALLRYRGIAYRLYPSAAGVPGMPVAKPPLLPTFYLEDADGQTQAVTDSTPLIRRFEAAFAGRNVVPDDPALAFIDALLEDFADEWLTKAMFHYRWTYPADIDKAGRVLAGWHEGPKDDATLSRIATQISDRQISRLRYVGSNPMTGPVIEAGYLRVLQALEEHLRHFPFLMGARPGSGDFAMYGQLTQLAQFDPTPAAIASAHAPRVCAWVALLEDLSGLVLQDGQWLSMDPFPDSLHRLLGEVGRLYVPVMLANAQALAAGQDEVHAVVDGQPWVQQSFAYQSKCLAWLRRDYRALTPPARAKVDQVLAGTGCQALLIGL